MTTKPFWGWIGVRRGVSLGFLAVAICALLVAATAVAGPGGSHWRGGRVLLKVRSGLPEARLAEILAKHGGRRVLHRVAGRYVGRLEKLGVQEIDVPPGAEKRIAQALSENPSVEFVELDQLVELAQTAPNDPKYGSAWHLPKIQAPAAWDYALGDGVIVAILDTGVDPAHADLLGQLMPGWNAASDNSDTSDIAGHGTMVAGTVAAASNNGAGVASIAWNAHLLPIRVTNSTDGSAYTSVIAAGIKWAADQGARVANVSYDASASATLASAAAYMRGKGGIVVVAGGNSGATLTGNANSPDLIAVAATDSNDNKASWSTAGNHIDVSAPGVGIWTTTNGGGYGAKSGTSFSSPLTAGVVALIMSANPSLSPDEVELILESSVDDLGTPGWDPQFGFGRINASNAVLQAFGSTPPPLDHQAPTVAFATPAPDASVADLVPITIDATDDTGVTEVVLYADGQQVAVDDTAPFEFSWDSTQHANGTATLTPMRSTQRAMRGSSSWSSRWPTAVRLAPMTCS